MLTVNLTVLNFFKNIYRIDTKTDIFRSREKNRILAIKDSKILTYFLNGFKKKLAYTLFILQRLELLLVYI